MAAVPWLVILLYWLAISNGEFERHKRHTSFSEIFQQVKNVIEATNRELADRKEVDRVMLEQGMG